MKTSDRPPGQPTRPRKPPYEATFTYTVGLTYTFEHPEIVLVGSWQHAALYLNLVGQMVESGQRFAAGATTDELLDGFTVRFGPVGDAPRPDLLTWADWAAQGQPFEALHSSCRTPPVVGPQTRTTTPSRSRGSADFRCGREAELLAGLSLCAKSGCQCVSCPAARMSWRRTKALARARLETPLPLLRMLRPTRWQRLRRRGSELLRWWWSTRPLVARFAV
jgi:hypothetical protein